MDAVPPQKQPLSGALTERPAEYFEFTSPQAENFLGELGLLGSFPVDRKPAVGRQVLTHFTHPTHFILAIRFGGGMSEANYGHLVVCYPKAVVSGTKFLESVATLVKAG